MKPTVAKGKIGKDDVDAHLMLMAELKAIQRAAKVDKVTDQLDRGRGGGGKDSGDHMELEGRYTCGINRGRKILRTSNDTEKSSAATSWSLRSSGHRSAICVDWKKMDSASNDGRMGMGPSLEGRNKERLQRMDKLYSTAEIIIDS